MKNILVKQYIPPANKIYAFIFIGIAVLGLAISPTAYFSPYLTLITSGIVIGFFVSILKPHLLYFITIPLIGFRSILVWLWMEGNRFSFSIVEPVIIFSFIIWLIARAAGYSNSYIKNKSDLPLALIIIWGAISILWSQEQRFGIFLIIMLTICVIYYLLANIHLQSFKRIKWAIALFVSMGLINAILCIYSQIYTQNTVIKLLADYESHYATFWFNPEGYLRAQGFMHPLKTAYFLSIAIALSFGYIYVAHSVYRWFFAFLTYFMFIALICSLSKGPMLSLFSGLFALSILVKKLRKNLLAFWALIIVLFVFAFFLSRLPTGDYMKALDYTSQTATSSDDEKTSIGSRIIRWKTGIKSLFEYNLAGGTGSGGFYYYIEDFELFDSLYFHILIEYGLIGAGLWFWFLFSLIKRCIEAYNSSDSELKKWMCVYIAGLVTLLFNGLSSENQIFLPIWFYLGIGNAFANIILTKKHNTIQLGYS